MQVTVERTGPCQAKIIVNVPSSEFESEMRKILADAGRNLRVKGFRPGHVPPQVVEKLHGKEVRKETKNRFFQKALDQAVEEQKIKPLAHPRVELPEGDLLAGSDFAFDFEVDLRPEFELGDYKGVEIESALQAVTDAEVDAAIEQVAKNNARPEPAGEAGLGADGMALAKVEFVFNDEVVFLRDGLRLSPSAPIPGVEPVEVEKSLTGAKDGDVIEMPAIFPIDFEREEARGQPGVCRVTIQQAFKIVLPAREELVKGLQLESEAQLVERVREKLEEANRDFELRRVENAIVERLIDQHSMELPEKMLTEQVQSRLENLRRELASQGLPPAQIEEQVVAQEQPARIAAERATRGYFLIEAIAQKEALKVSDEDMVRELRTIAERNRTSFEDVRNYYRENNLLPQLAMEIVERKVKAFLREGAAATANQAQP